jgi:hypothetical protein
LQVPTTVRLELWQATGGLLQRGTASAVGNQVKFLRGVLIAGIHGHPIERPPAQIRCAYPSAVIKRRRTPTADLACPQLLSRPLLMGQSPKGDKDAEEKMCLVFPIHRTALSITIRSLATSGSSLGW